MAVEASDRSSGCEEGASGADAETGDGGAIRAKGIGSGIARGSTDTGDDIAALGSIAARSHGVGIVARGRPVVKDADGERLGIRVAVDVGDFDRINRAGGVARGRAGQREIVADRAGDRIEAGDRQHAALARDGLADAGYGGAVNRHSRWAIGRGESDRAAGRSRRARVGTGWKSGLEYQRARRIGTRDRSDRDGTVADRNHQAGSRGIAVAVGQLIAEGIGGSAWSARVAGIGVAAVGGERQLAELAVDGRSGGNEAAGGAGAEAGDGGAVSAFGISPGVARGSTRAGNHVAALGSIAARSHGVGIVARGRRIVVDADGQIGAGRIAVRIGDGHAEDVGGGVARSRLGQQIAVADCARRDAGDCQRADRCDEGLPDSGDRHTVESDRAQAIQSHVVDRAGSGRAGSGSTAQRKPGFVDRRSGIGDPGRVVRRDDDGRRDAVDQARDDLLRLGERESQLGIRQQVADREGALNRRGGIEEVAARAGWPTSRGLRLVADQ